MSAVAAARKENSTAPLEGGKIRNRPVGRHGLGPRMPSTVGATRTFAGASKNGIADTPAIPARIEPGKIWIALFS
jgi:hypothetical protein